MPEQYVILEEGEGRKAGKPKLVIVVSKETANKCTCVILSFRRKLYASITSGWLLEDLHHGLYFEITGDHGVCAATTVTK
jgi:hypothetical protein